MTFSPCGPYFRNTRITAAAAAGLLRRLLDQAEALDVALVLQDPRNLRLQLAGRHVHARVLGGHGVADAREHVGNRIGHFCSLVD